MSAFAPKDMLKCRNGCVASSQGLATEIGVEILKRGGNAADSAVAVAAALNVMEPCSTGLGGDAFCLFYDKKSNKIQAINASGRSPQGLTLESLTSLGYKEGKKPIPQNPYCITVPGACAGWVNCVEKFGSGNLTMYDILEPAINLAENGFTMTSPITQNAWAKDSHLLSDEKNTHGKELLFKDETSSKLRAPNLGETFRNPTLANVMKTIAKQGMDGFYKGWVADSIVKTVQSMGGLLTHKDLENYTATVVDPISIEYKGYRLWEIPPNCQGIVALEALNILKNFDFSCISHNSVEYLHTLIESFRLSFNDALKYCGDMEFSKPPLDLLLDEKYGKKLAEKINPGQALGIHQIENGATSHGDTVYFTTADAEGNFCSFINSNYMGFGTGIVPEGCGFTLQNRGYNFSLKPGHPNVVAPRKRPYHTIIPAMVTDAKTGEAVMSYGVMGGFMQPQGHVQVLLNMLEYGMNPQEALDAPRLLVGSGHLGAVGGVNIETGIPPDVIDALRCLGHDVTGPIDGFRRSLFGRGQIIANRQIWKTGGGDGDCLWAGSDVRADGKTCGVDGV